ncbi:MAG: tRNA preQ1(34) S-adenosylmethionine ribosyltransferase-isomerase QueA [Candidatus Promineifilaceae bacterium]
MLTADFDYHLPADRIAQTPVEPRDSSRLMVVHRDSGEIEHRTFRDISDYLNAGDVLVANNSRVIPARLMARKTTGGKSEILLLEKLDETSWKALVKGKRTRPGTKLDVLNKSAEPSGVRATILAEMGGAERLLTFGLAIEPLLPELGHMPIPPYISAELTDAERYQTIYSRPEGSAAAPTAGLHFTPDLMLSLREQRVQFETVTLHVGLDTFQPVKSDTVAGHAIHQEWVSLGLNSAETINRASVAGNRIIAVGTTSVRVLETAAWRAAGEHGTLQQVSTIQTPPACPWKPVAPYEGQTDLFIYPGYNFRAVDILLTNFHLPKSSLLMLVSAFASYDLMRHAYDVAIKENYRFFSFGDAMLII